MNWGLEVMRLPGVRMSSAWEVRMRFEARMEMSPWTSTPPSESESKSKSDSGTGGWAGCGRRIVIGISVFEWCEN